MTDAQVIELAQQELAASKAQPSSFVHCSRVDTLARAVIDLSIRLAAATAPGPTDVEVEPACVAALREHQTQLDQDGVMVGVSRQAVDEMLAHTAAMRKELAQAKAETIAVVAEHNRIAWAKPKITSAYALGLAFLAEHEKLKARVVELEAKEQICLLCGQKTPCMTEADLKPNDPGVPCTFECQYAAHVIPKWRERYEADLAAARAKQKTPGMVEVCPQSWRLRPNDGGCAGVAEECYRPGCPLRAKESADG